MSYEWRPETPEEIAEHQRMRRELLESREMNDNKIINYQTAKKQKRRPRSILLMCFIVLVALYFLSKVDWDATNDKVDTPDNTINTPFSYGDDFQYGKSVSENTSDYIQQSKVITEAWNKLHTGFYVQTYDGVPFMCNDDVENIKIIIEGIERLKLYKIYATDFEPFKKACDNYYKETYDFFSEFSKKNRITMKKYNEFVVQLNTLADPHDVLIEILKEKNYYFYIDKDNTVHYKYNDSIF